MLRTIRNATTQRRRVGPQRRQDPAQIRTGRPATVTRSWTSPRIPAPASSTERPLNAVYSGRHLTRQVHPARKASPNGYRHHRHSGRRAPVGGSRCPGAGRGATCVARHTREVQTQGMVRSTPRRYRRNSHWRASHKRRLHRPWRHRPGGGFDQPAIGTGSPCRGPSKVPHATPVGRRVNAV
jgi:hypothetical protein